MNTAKKHLTVVSPLLVIALSSTSNLFAAIGSKYQTPTPEPMRTCEYKQYQYVEVKPDKPSVRHKIKIEEGKTLVRVDVVLDGKLRHGYFVDETNKPIRDGELKQMIDEAISDGQAIKEVLGEDENDE